MTEAGLLNEVDSTIILYERINGALATATWNMIEERGVIKALSDLVVSPDLQQGFRVLRDSGQLDRTFEAIIVRFAHLFEPGVVDAARWRLENATQLL